MTNLKALGLALALIIGVLAAEVQDKRRAARTSSAC